MWIVHGRAVRDAARAADGPYLHELPETAESMTPEQLVTQCQKVMAHAWMVRTFIKHSDEVEDFPELMDLVRTVFDVSRALETRVADPPGYVKMLGKKLGKLRGAAEAFRTDAPTASSHTNFQQAVISMDACVEELARLLTIGRELLPLPTVMKQANSPQTGLPENPSLDDDTGEEFSSP